MENSIAITSLNNTKAISFARISCSVSVSKLQIEVDKLLQNPLPNTWVDHVNKKDYVGSWDVLPLRCQQQHLQAHPVLQSFSIEAGNNWENLPVLEECPEIHRIFEQLHCPLKAARLMRLKAGAEIKPHRDQGLSIEFGEARLHLPIYTSDAVSFIVNDKTIPMEAGELWYFNADQVHEVYNHSNEDRINLVIDCVANEWLCQKIYTGTVSE